MGVSVESADYIGRIDELRKTNAAVKFLSLEPLLGPLENLDLRGIDWAIAGGESGPTVRPMKPIGCGQSAISAWPQALPSILNSGAVPTRRRQVAYWTEELGTNNRPSVLLRPKNSNRTRSSPK